MTERRPWHTERTAAIEEKYRGRNDDLSFTDRREVLRDLVSDIKDQGKQEALLDRLTDRLLGQYGVSTSHDLEPAMDDLERAGIAFVMEASDGGNLGGLNKFHHEIHADADKDVQKVWGEVMAQESQKYGAMVFRTGGDEFRVLWPNYTKQEVAEIRADIEDQVRNRTKELGLDQIGHPKKGNMPTGALYTSYGMADSREFVNPFTQQVNRGDLDRVADKAQGNMAARYIVKVANEHGYGLNPETKMWTMVEQKQEVTHERGSPKHQMGAEAGRRSGGEGPISGRERGRPGNPRGSQSAIGNVRKHGETFSRQITESGIDAAKSFADIKAAVKNFDPALKSQLRSAIEAKINAPRGNFREGLSRTINARMGQIQQMGMSQRVQNSVKMGF